MRWCESNIEVVQRLVCSRRLKGPVPMQVPSDWPAGAGIRVIRPGGLGYPLAGRCRKHPPSLQGRLSAAGGLPLAELMHPTCAGRDWEIWWSVVEPI